MRALSPVLLLIALLTFQFSASLRAEDALLLPPAFQAGKDYYIRYQQTAGASNGMKVEMLMDVAIRCERKPRTLKQKTVTAGFQRVRVAFGGVTYDSSDAATSESPLAPVFKSLLESSWVTHYDREGRIESQDLPSDLLEDNPLAGMAGPGLMREMLELVANPGIPALGVLPGDSWEMSFKHELPDAGELSGTSDVTYEGMRVIDGKTLAILSWTGDLEADLKTRGAETDPSTRIQSRSQSLSGRMLIDPSLNFPVSTERSIRLTLRFPDPVREGETVTIPIQHRTVCQLLRVRSF